jgi:uncharacterized lipoprotein YmbA
MRKLILLLLALMLAACQSSAPKWEMWRLDKHYRPHRVL